MIPWVLPLSALRPDENLRPRQVLLCLISLKTISILTHLIFRPVNSSLIQGWDDKIQGAQVILLMGITRKEHHAAREGCGLCTREHTVACILAEKQIPGTSQPSWVNFFGGGLQKYASYLSLLRVIPHCPEVKKHAHSLSYISLPHCLA